MLHSRNDVDHPDAVPDLDDLDYFLQGGAERSQQYQKIKEIMDRCKEINDYEVICDEVPTATPEEAYERAMRGL